MKRRGFLGVTAGALGSALTGKFVVSNPTVLDNGLVVPASAAAPERVAPEVETEPIAITTATSIPRAAALVGSIRSWELSCQSDDYSTLSMEMILWEQQSARDLMAFRFLPIGRNDSYELYLVKTPRGK